MMEENQTSTTNQNDGGNSKKWIMIAVAVIVIIAFVAAGGFFFLNSNSDSTEGDAMMEGEFSDGHSVDDAMMKGDETSYSDGTYTAVGTYSYHSGTESVKVTLTIESGVVTDTVVVSQAVAPISKQMQKVFIDNYESEVIGVDLHDLKLGKVSGSSLTGNGFNSAVEDIKVQAS